MPFSILQNNHPERTSSQKKESEGLLESEVEIGMNQGKIKVKIIEQANTSFSLSWAPSSSPLEKSDRKCLPCSDIKSLYVCVSE